MEQKVHKSAVRDMTDGPILGHLVKFSLPLLLGNIFQLLYNTVDTLVVGNFVGKEALAAVGSTSMIINVIVMFASGLAIGASVVNSQNFGAKDYKALHTSIETTIAVTFLMGIVLTVLGVAYVKPMLRLMSTPDDVMEAATTYLRIYLGGISGLFFYNMGSGILRSVGDTTRPLVFLIVSSVLNIVLDLLFVIVFRMGIAGVAWATIISQFISAVLILLLLSVSSEVYRLTWRDLRIDGPTLKRIFRVGMPAGIQSSITAFSNVFVQSYVNVFGSSVMAGWSTYNKLDQYVFLPMQSTASAATTFVSQNIGAQKEDRADRGTWTALVLTVSVTAAICAVLVAFAGLFTGLFTSDPEVIACGVLFVRVNTVFLIFNCVNHVLAGALRGRGDSRGPMVIMLVGFVAVRQTYLFCATRFFANTPAVVGFGYPVGWMVTCFLEVGYFFFAAKRRKKQRTLTADEG